jgi:hypothetical protein
MCMMLTWTAQLEYRLAVGHTDRRDQVRHRIGAGERRGDVSPNLDDARVVYFTGVCVCAVKVQNY